jgi:hypothetical protein
MPPARLLAVAVAVAAAAVFVARFPAAVRMLNERARTNAHLSATGRTIQGADGLDISNDFLVQALRLLPRDATYTVQEPPSAELSRGYGISTTTYDALPAYVEYLLLPRRPADAHTADYLLCYACDTKPFDARLQRLWTDPSGLVIGRLRR